MSHGVSPYGPNDPRSPAGAQDITSAGRVQRVVRRLRVVVYPFFGGRGGCQGGSPFLIGGVGAGGRGAGGFGIVTILLD